MRIWLSILLSRRFLALNSARIKAKSSGWKFSIKMTSFRSFTSRSAVFFLFRSEPSSLNGGALSAYCRLVGSMDRWKEQVYWKDSRISAASKSKFGLRLLTDAWSNIGKQKQLMEKLFWQNMVLNKTQHDLKIKNVRWKSCFLVVLIFDLESMVILFIWIKHSAFVLNWPTLSTFLEFCLQIFCQGAWYPTEKTWIALCNNILTTHCQLGKRTEVVRNRSITSMTLYTNIG